MADRFNRVYQLQSNLYTDGSPVIIENGVLLYDTVSGQNIIQLKFHSVREKVITELSVDIGIQDAISNQVGGQINYCYQNLYDSSGSRFGQTKAIVVANKAAKAFVIRHVKVVFEDQSTWENTAEFEPLSEPQQLFFALTDNEVLKQYRLATSSAANFIPARKSGLWQCTCGEWNCGAVCTKCKLSADTVFGAYDIERLTKDAQVRVAEEQEQLEKERVAAEERKKLEQEKLEGQQKAEQERLRVEAEQQEIIRKARVKKAKISAAIITPVVSLILLFVFWIYPNVVVPANEYNEAMELLSSGRYDEARQAFLSLGNYKDAPEMELEAKYQQADALLSDGDYEEAIRYFKAVGDYKDAADCLEDAQNRMLEEKYETAMRYINEAKYDQAHALFEELGNYKDSKQQLSNAAYLKAEMLYTSGDIRAAAVAYSQVDQSEKMKQRSLDVWDEYHGNTTVALGYTHLVCVLDDRTVAACGNNDDGKCNVDSWQDVVSVSTGWSDHTLGLRYDGTVLACGANEVGQCNVSNWDQIISISSGAAHSVGLKMDGTAVAVGNNTYGQCDVNDWNNIVAISCGLAHTVGLKENGDVVAIGDNTDGQCDVSSWHNIVSISAGARHTVGLKADGTVVSTGWNEDRQCDVGTWSDIISISANAYHTVGIRSNHSVVGVGWDVMLPQDVNNWSNIYAIFAGGVGTIGFDEHGQVHTTIASIEGINDGCFDDQDRCLNYVKFP